MTPICADRRAGFTLLEVMVALIIVSLGMMAVSAQLGRFAAASYEMEQKTLASWIASNKITELSIAREWPELGTQQDEIEFANRSWLLRTEVSETDVDNLRRVDVFVMRADEPEEVVRRLMGFVEPPQQSAALPRGYGPAGSTGERR